MTFKPVFLPRIVPVIVLAAAPAAAQPVEHPAEVSQAPAVAATAQSLVLAVDIAAGGALDPATVRTALAAELGVTVVEADAFAPSLGRLAIEVSGDVLRVTYQPASGERVTREVALPAAQSDRVQLVGFIATNLVRDQVSALLATLAVPPEPAAPPEAPPPPVVVIPPPPAPTPAPPPRATSERMLPATIGLIPPLAVDRLAGTEVSVGLGIHAVMGMTDRSRVASISGVADVQRRSVDGVQIGGAVAVAGERVHGAQIGGAVAFSRHIRGLQIGGAASAAQRVDGLQIGGAVSAAQRVDGLQIGGAVSAAGRVDGLQLGGAASIAGDVHGAQIGGAINVARDVRGLQLGAINVARKVRGVQLGVINVSDDSDDAYPIGVLNFARNGRVEVDGWVESSKLSALALRHGPRHIHNLVALAWTPDHEHLLAGFGIGLHRNLSQGPRPITLDVDAVNWWTNLWDGRFAQLDQLRVTVAVPVGAVDLFAGAAANVYISDEMDESANFHPVMARRVSNDAGVHVVTWPSVFAGVRMHAR